MGDSTGPPGPPVSPNESAKAVSTADIIVRGRTVVGAAVKAAATTGSGTDGGAVRTALTVTAAGLAAAAADGVDATAGWADDGAAVDSRVDRALTGLVLSLDDVAAGCLAFFTGVGDVECSTLDGFLSDVVFDAPAAVLSALFSAAASLPEP